MNEPYEGEEKKNLLKTLSMSSILVIYGISFLNGFGSFGQYSRQNMLNR